MGETPAETLREIEATRAQLDRDLQVLESRLPDRDTMVRQLQIAAGVAGGGVVALIGTFVATRRALKVRKRRRLAGYNAEAIRDIYPDAFGGAVRRPRSKKPLVALGLVVAGAGAGGAAVYQRKRAQQQATSDELWTDSPAAG